MYVVSIQSLHFYGGLGIGGKVWKPFLVELYSAGIFLLQSVRQCYKICLPGVRPVPDAASIDSRNRSTSSGGHRSKQAAVATGEQRLTGFFQCIGESALGSGSCLISKIVR